MSAGSAIASGFFNITGAGLLFGLLASPRAELGRFFSTLHAVLAAACFVLALPFAPGGGVRLGGIAATGLALLFTAALYLPQGRGGRGMRPGGRAGDWLLWPAAVAAAWTLGLEARETAHGIAPALYVAAAVASAGLLGAVIVGMNLGHWYLVRVRLSEIHLVRFARFLAAAVALRAGLLVAITQLYGAALPEGPGGYLRALAVDRGFFFWQRVFFGLAGPAVFAYMIHETARIRSTQSATGILYIAVIFVLIGEFLARFLTVRGAGPL